MRISDWSSDVCSSDLVGPDQRVGDTGRVAEQAVVIDPVDRDIGVAQHISEEDRPERPQPAGFGRDRGMEFEHHDRDDDRDHAVRKRLDPADAARAFAGLAHCWTKAPLIVSSTSSEISAMPYLLPKSMRLIVVVAAKPTLTLGGPTGSIPAPT